MMNSLTKLGQFLRLTNSVMHTLKTTNPSLEAVYRDLFVRDLAKLGLDDVYYPVGGAANHSLLYLIGRCFQELPIRNALELGAGQSSVLIDALNERLEKGARVRTVEQDPAWATEIRKRVRHEIHLAELAAKPAGGRTIQHYGGAYFEPSVRYDFVLIDGPTAHRAGQEYNRLGALELVPAQLADDFVLIVDDAERHGENRLVDGIRRRLDEAGREYQQTAILAAKAQYVCASGAFARAAFF